MNPRELQIEARQLTVSIAGKRILKNIDLGVAAGEILCIVGANGAGKSSLVKALAGQILPETGQVNLAGRPISSWTAQERAQRLALLNQQFNVQIPFRVRELIELGAYPYRGLWTRQKLTQAVSAAMQYFHVADLAGRDYINLSGGEKQRVQFARVLLQIELGQGELPRVLLLDEPSAHLDIAHQQEVLKRLRQLVNHHPVAIVMVLHDLNLALTYADRVLMLHRGEVYLSGLPQAVLRAEQIKAALGAKMVKLAPELGGWLVPET